MLRHAVHGGMWNGRSYQLASAEDIYAGVESDEASVPSCRRVTIPVTRPKYIAMQEDAEASKVEALKNKVRDEIEKSELTAAAVRAGDVVPDQSMRRIKVAKRVVGVPDDIREQISDECLRDPRRD